MIASISKGQQITIPVELRELLGLDVGSRVNIEEENGKIVIELLGNGLEHIFEETQHLKPKHRLTAEQMDELQERALK